MKNDLLKVCLLIAALMPFSMLVGWLSKDECEYWRLHAYEVAVVGVVSINMSWLIHAGLYIQLSWLIGATISLSLSLQMRPLTTIKAPLDLIRHGRFEYNLINFVTDWLFPYFL